ncbi:GTP-binding protein [Candidatus Woesearchaeota archaeon]|nr:MAG: GTP-binding protein [Candidatus Woesearchaeota archaeon]
MNFQNIPPVPKSDEIIDKALKRARTNVSLLVQKARKAARKKERKDSSQNIKLQIARQAEMSRISVISDIIASELREINSNFPSFDSLTEFYRELVKATLDYASLKKSLAGMKWGAGKMRDLQRTYQKKVSSAAGIEQLSRIKREFIGRATSVVKQLKDNLAYLAEARKTLRQFPSVKSRLFTVSLYGFPNVGKTTLLSKITASSPEIADYAFTTKTLNIGYALSGNSKIQVIDTPGTLSRPDRMNRIEMQAEIALKHAAHYVVLVFDPTESWPMEQQIQLLKKMKKLGKPFAVYISKTDVSSDDQQERAMEEISRHSNADFITSPEELVTFLFEKEKEFRNHASAS